MIDVLAELPGPASLILKAKSVHFRWALRGA